MIRPTSKQLYGAGVGTAVAVVSLGIGLSAARSIPGDPAYGLKQAVTELQTALAPSGTERAERYLDNSEAKVLELEKLLRQGAPEEVVAETAERVVSSDRNAQAEIEASRARGVATGSVEARAAASYRDRQVQLQKTADRIQGPAYFSLRRVLESPLRSVTAPQDGDILQGFGR